jgi:hypothetical protein
MSDRYHSLVVSLKEDMHEEHLQRLIHAIELMRGVLSVDRNVANIESHVAEERARRDLGEQILKVIYPKENR